eukprot:g80709.t1
MINGEFSIFVFFIFCSCYEPQFILHLELEGAWLLSWLVAQISILASGPCCGVAGMGSGVSSPQCQKLAFSRVVSGLSGAGGANATDAMGRFWQPYTANGFVNSHAVYQTSSGTPTYYLSHSTLWDQSWSITWLDPTTLASKLDWTGATFSADYSLYMSTAFMTVLSTGALFPEEINLDWRYRPDTSGNYATIAFDLDLVCTPTGSYTRTNSAGPCVAAPTTADTCRIALAQTGYATTNSQFQWVVDSTRPTGCYAEPPGADGSRLVYLNTASTGVACSPNYSCLCHRGECTSPGNCYCSTGWAGKKCDVCASNYYPAADPVNPSGSCTKYCLASTTCQGHGSCQADGDCYCDAGYYGTSCIICPAGKFCPKGTVTPLDCGSVSVFCPSGSSSQTLASVGYYTTGSDSALVRPTQAPCEAGWYCIAGQRNRCDPGEWSAFTRTQCSSCSAGRYSDGNFLATTSMCQGACQPGYTCPSGSSSPTQKSCPAGSWSNAGESSENCQPCSSGRYGTGISTTNQCSGPCTAGYFCPERSTNSTAQRCPAGTFSLQGEGSPLCQSCVGGRFGSYSSLRTSSSCEGPCQAGYWCPERSGSATANKCGDISLFCPLNAASPSAVLVGYYSAGSTDPATRSGQSACERGSYCVGGEKFTCKPGTYTSLTGQAFCVVCDPGRFGLGASNSSLCSGPCQAGYTCPAGSTSATSSPCPAGSWSSSGESTLGCQPCSAGRYGTGLSTDSTCTGPCAPGYFCPERSTRPDPPESRCPGGTWSGPGETSALCQSCAAGRFGGALSLRTNSSCEGPCAPGYWCPQRSSEANANECGDASLICPQGSAQPSVVSIGYYSIGGSSAATKSAEVACEAGFLCVRGIRQRCAAGTYTSLTGQDLCLWCDPGRFGLGGSNSSLCSGPCQAGYTCPAGSTSATSGPCPAGSWSSSGEFTLGCQPCSAGRYGTGLSTDSTCTGPCRAGYFCPERSTRPDPPESRCPGGTWSGPGETSALCQSCAAGRFGGALSVRTNSSCEGPCAAGYWCPQRSSEADANECGDASLICPEGSVKPSIVSIGYYSIGGSSASTRTAQLECEPDFFCAAGVKAQCETGTVAVSSGASFCRVPDNGFYLDRNETLLPCNSGYFCQAGRRYECGAIGEYCPDGASSAKVATLGYFTTPVDSPPALRTGEEMCPAGSFCVQGEKIACALGSWSRAGQVSCTACPPGRYGNESGAAVDRNCSGLTPPGTFSLAGAEEPIACAPGFFQNESGKSICYPCAAGSFAPHEGSVNCAKCAAGFFQTNTGQNHCPPCPKGHYSAADADACTACERGRYNSNVNATACLSCPAGSFQAGLGQTACYECGPGSLSAEPGAESCEDCQAGKYSLASSSSCLACEPGHFANLPGSSVCSPCAPLQAVRADQPCVSCPTNAFSKDGVTCLCAVGFFYNEGLKSCQTCAPGVACYDVGITSSNLTVENGFFLEPLLETFEPIRCVQAGACVGGFTASLEVSRNALCGPNRHGPLCAQCVEGTYDWGTCDVCEKSTYIPVIIAGLFFIFTYVLVIHKLANPAVPNGDGSVKTAMFFISTLRLLLDNKVWLSWLGLVSLQLNSTSSGGRCLLPLLPQGKMVMQVCIPITALFFLIFTGVLRKVYLIQRKRRQEWSIAPFVRALCALLIVSYTTIADTALSALDCIAIGNLRLVRTAPAIDCDSQEYKRLLPFVYAIVVFPVATFPFLIAIVLYFYHRRGRIEYLSSHMGVLFENYDAEMYLFESAALLRRTLFVLVFAVLRVDAVTKFQLYVLLCLCFLVLHALTRPYVLPKDDVFETISLSGLTLIALVQTGRLNEQLPRVVQIIITTIVALVALCFVFLQLYTKPQLHLHRICPKALVDLLDSWGVTSRKREGPSELELQHMKRMAMYAKSKLSFHRLIL